MIGGSRCHALVAFITLLPAAAASLATTGQSATDDNAKAQAALREPRMVAAQQKYVAGDPKGALADFEAACQSAPDNGFFPFVVADFLVQRQDYAAAAGFAERAWKKLPDQPPAHNLWASCLLFTDRAEQGEAVLRAAVARFEATPSGPNLLFGVGMACAINHKFLEAQEWFAKALERDPLNVLFLFSSAENLLNLHRLPEAEQQFRKAHGGKPRHPDAGWKLAVVLGMQGKDEESERLFRSALGEGPSSARLAATYQLAIFLFERRRAAEAEPLLLQVTQARPDDRMAWHYLARTLHVLGKKDEAKAALQRYQALQAAADRAESDFLLGLIRQQLEGGSVPSKPEAPPGR